MVEPSLLSQLSAADMELLCRRGVERSYPKGHVLIQQGERGDSLYFLKDGQLKVYVIDTEGKETILCLLQPGQHLGELALLDDAPRSASACCLTPARVVAITRAEFTRVLAERPELAMRLLRGLCERVRVLTDLVQEMATNDVYTRVTRLLHKLAVPADGAYVIDQPLTQQELGNMVGASREMVSRVLRELQKSGYIELRDKRIRVLGRLPSVF